MTTPAAAPTTPTPAAAPPAAAPGAGAPAAAGAPAQVAAPPAPAATPAAGGFLSPPPTDSGEKAGADAGKTPEGAKPEAKPGEAAPPEAELTLKLPEGVTEDAVLLGEFKPLAKELGLKGEAAQRLVDLHVKALQGAQKQVQEAMQQTQAKWADELKADKDIGGAQYEASRLAANRALKAYDPDGTLTKFLGASGLANHPGLSRFMAKVGKAMADDSVAGSSGSVPADDKSPEAFHRKLYPNTPELFSKS